MQTASLASQKGTETVPELVAGLVWRVGVVGIQTLFFWLIERSQKTVFPHLY